MQSNKILTDEFVECPYDPLHQMLRKRLIPHLIKCRANHPDFPMGQCLFNKTHLVPEPELVFHMHSCPDRKLITQYKYNEIEVKEEEPIEHKPIECDDNWDDVDVEDYNPLKKVADVKVKPLRQGLQKLQRKTYFKEEEDRIGDSSGDEYDRIQRKAAKRKKRSKELPYMPERDRLKRRNEYKTEEDNFAKRNLYEEEIDAPENDSPVPPPPPRIGKDAWKEALRKLEK